MSVFGPTGNLVYGAVGKDGQFKQDPGATKYATQIQETDFQKGLRQQQEGGTLDLVSSIIGQGMPDRAVAKNTDDIAKNTFDRFMYDYAPQRETEDMRMFQTLSDRGIPLIGGAGREALDDLGRRRTGENAQLMRTAAADAGAEQSRQFGVDSQARSTALNELLTALSGGINPSKSTLSPANSSGVNMADLMSKQYSAQMGQYNNQQSQNNAALGTAANLAMAFLSNAAMKQDFRPVEGSILEKIGKLDIQTWAYTPESGEDHTVRHVGPTAQQFKEIFGVGDGRTIALVDVAGVVLATLKELADVRNR